MIKIYIASPYTVGDVAVNVRRQLDTAEFLLNLGFAPYVPLLCHFQHLVHPREYQSWIDLTSEFLLVCDGVLRLSGESKGADLEVQLAKSANIPVFTTISALAFHFGKDAVRYVKK